MDDTNYGPPLDTINDLKAKAPGLRWTVQLDDSGEEILGFTGSSQKFAVVVCPLDEFDVRRTDTIKWEAEYLDSEPGSPDREVIGRTAEEVLDLLIRRFDLPIHRVIQ